MDPASRRRATRVLLLFAVVIGAASIALEYRFEQRAASDRDTSTRIDLELGALQLTLERLHAAQAAYTAHAQNPDAWMRHVDEAVDAASVAFARFRERDLSPEGQLHVDAAMGAFEVLVGADARARDAVRGDLRLLAADAIFLDSASAVEQASAEIAAARTVERRARNASQAEQTAIRQIAHASAVGLIVLLALIVGRLRLQPQVSEAATMAQMLRELPPPVKSPAASSANSAGGTPRPPETAPRTSDPPPAPVPADAVLSGVARPAALANLPAAAELCGDLARVIDVGDVPALLARAATVLDARGVIIWVADRDARRLEPALSHGYAETVIRRLGTLAVDADNVTSLAFRTRRPQKLDAAVDAAHGAVAIPLVTAHGCVGVLAAEVGPDGLVGESVALARVIAAQFATLIAPDTGGKSQAARA